MKKMKKLNLERDIAAYKEILKANMTQLLSTCIIPSTGHCEKPCNFTKYIGKCVFEFRKNLCTI
jgi:hypothetical protein